jgi:sugar phosphate isomerase/epimerase
MRPLLGIQLYTVREAAGQDYAGTMKKIADMGYEAVEPAGFPGTTVDEAVKIYNDLGFKVISCHGKLPLGDDKNEVLEMAQKLGVKYLFSGIGSDWDSVDGIKAKADTVSEAAANAASIGLKVGIHNHDYEMNIVDGKPGYRIFLEHAAPEVIWQIDTYWVKVGGLNPVEVVQEIGPRCPVVHIKDGMGERGTPFKPVGQGVMDIPSVLKAASDKEAYVVEQDSGEGCMVENARQSIDYLKSVL